LVHAGSNVLVDLRLSPKITSSRDSVTLRTRGTTSWLSAPRS